jgi:hypothetical protein
MRRVILVVALGILASAAFADDKNTDKDKWQPTPVMRIVQPDTGKAGDVVVVKGEFLEKTRVAEVYLTTGPENIRVQILSQSGEAIKFKIPANAKTGRMRLMVLTTGLEPQFLEQPVFFTVQ